jgi:hypothetical protein
MVNITNIGLAKSLFERQPSGLVKCLAVQRSTIVNDRWSLSGSGSGRIKPWAHFPINIIVYSLTLFTVNLRVVIITNILPVTVFTASLSLIQFVNSPVKSLPIFRFSLGTFNVTVFTISYSLIYTHISVLKVVIITNILPVTAFTVSLSLIPITVTVPKVSNNNNSFFVTFVAHVKAHVLIHIHTHKLVLPFTVTVNSRYYFYR